MKRVLLVNANTETRPYPVPPLGLCLAAASIAERFDVRVHDGTFDRGRGVAAVVRDFAPDYVGVGVRNVDDVIQDGGTHYVAGIHTDFVRPIRDATTAPLVLGGAGFSIFPGPLMDALGADFGVGGEAEEAFPALLAALETGGRPEGVPGVVVRGGNTPSAAARRTAASGPALFSRVDAWIDFTPYRQRGSYPIQTKRGCAHECVYCTYPTIEGRGYRLRPPREVVREIAEAADRLGPVTFEVVDSTFNYPADHVRAICDEIVARGLSVRLRTMGVNPGGLDADLLARMKRAGFAQIDCTPDSASPAMLASLGKNFTREALERAAMLLAEFDMPTMWCFVFGGPGETEATVRETLDFIDRRVSDRDMVHMTQGLRIYPGTPLHAIALRAGIVDAADDLLASRFYVSPAIGRERLAELLCEASNARPNCLRAQDATPDPAMMREAMALRAATGLTEPMFRTLLRLRRDRMRQGA
jgi:radical SAM superfamily enzyme YgiQ (UPF0313 family)